MMNKEKKKVINRHFLIALATTVVLALLILVSNTTILSRFGGTINAPQSYTTDISVSEGGDGGDASLLPGTTNIRGAATTAGRFIMDVQAFSEDKQCSVNIPSGTVGLTKDRQPLTQISVRTNPAPPEPPEHSSVIGPVYNISPEGSTLYPTITVSLTYDPDKLPAGIKEKDLAIAMYNKATNRWVKLMSINIDPMTHIIRGQTNYFATFSIITNLN